MMSKKQFNFVHKKIIKSESTEVVEGEIVD